MAENWLLWAALSAVFAALTAVLTKLGVRNVDPDVAQFIRTGVVLAAAGILLVTAGKWRNLAAVDGAVWRWLTLAGLATAASWICYFRAMKAGDASRVAAVDRLSLVFVAVIAAVILKERLGPLGWLGVALASAGTVLISLSK